MIGSANGTRIGITGLGEHVPERVMTNDDLAQYVDTTDEWIRERTGIRERRIAADEEALTDIAMPGEDGYTLVRRVRALPPPLGAIPAVALTAYNDEDSIASAVRDFREHPLVDRVIVVSNNSTDRTAELSRKAGARVVFEPVNQIARARNAGARAATGDWLLFVDADSHPCGELFADLARSMESQRFLGDGFGFIQGNRPDNLFDFRDVMGRNAELAQSHAQ